MFSRYVCLGLGCSAPLQPNASAAQSCSHRPRALWLLPAAARAMLTLPACWGFIPARWAVVINDTMVCKVVKQMKMESESPSGKRERGSASKCLPKPSDPQQHPLKHPIPHYALHHPTSSSRPSSHILQTTQLRPPLNVEENLVARYLSGFQKKMRRGCPKQICPAVKLFFLIVQVSPCSSYPN